MTPLPRRGPLFLASTSIALLASSFALAFEIGDVGGHPLSVDITETAVVNYNFDNRNDTGVDDDWGVWMNRFNVQAQWYRFVFGIRVDNSSFFHTPDPNELAAEDAKDWKPTPGETRYEFQYNQTLDYGRDLSTRYRNVVYPSKIYFGYVTPELEATVGDVYAQYGRGLVLSVRKVDELAVDTTIRGGKIAYRVPMAKGAKLRLSGVAGHMNPLRVDEASGRVLEAPSAWYFAGMPTPNDTFYVHEQPSFVPDRIVGASIEGGGTQAAVGLATIGLHGVVLDRPKPCILPNAPNTCTPYANQFARGAGQVRNVSASLTLPNVMDHGSLYLEVAGQQQRNEDPPADFDSSVGLIRTSEEDLQGHAVYAAISADGGPFAFTFEGKHYRKFFPLTANIDADGAVQEFSLVQYSAPPTTLPVYVDTEAGDFNTCVTGGRGRLDARATEDLLVYGWLGRYATWAESTGVPDCEVKDETRNDVWDAAVGIEATFENKKSHVFVWVGARDDQLAQRDPVYDESWVFYRESYIRYDLLKKLSRQLYLQIQGMARRRHDQLKSPIPWWEGENYTALQWSPHLTVAFGYEYLTQKGHPSSYYNGSVKWRIDSGRSLRLFVGQQRGALRCISGVCREFPAFEGAKAEAVMRF